MNRTLVALAFLVAAGCAPSPQSILLLSNRMLDSKCAPQTLFLTAGSVNALVTDRYLAAFQIQSEMSPDPVTINGQVVTPGSRNDYIVARKVMHYDQVSGGAISPLGVPDQTISLYFVVPAGASATDTYVAMDLLTPDVATALAGRGAGTFQIQVTVHLEGALVNGETMSSSSATFPITVRNAAAPVCPVGTTLQAPDAPCGNVGQDGSDYSCA